MGIIPVKVPSIIKAALGVRKKSGREPRVMIAGSNLALIGRVDELLAPVGAHSRVLLHEVKVQGARSAIKAFDPDVVVVVAGQSDLTGEGTNEVLSEFIHELCRARKAWVPTVVNGGVIVTGALIDYMAGAARMTVSRIVHLPLDRPDDESVAILADQILDAAPDDLAVSLGASFLALRPCVLRRVISRVAAQNGVMATFGLAPGADIAILSANQIRMVLEIAAIHGETIDANRAKEVIATIAGGFILRTAARTLLGLIPVAGWIIKGGISAAGTYALGRAAVEYYSNPQFIVQVEAALRETSGKVFQAAGRAIE